MNLRVRTFARRSVAPIAIAIVLAFIVAFMSTAHESWDQHFIALFVRWFVSILSVVLLSSILDDDPEKPWRNWIPIPLSLVTATFVYCTVFDLQHDRPWMQSVSEIPVFFYWFACVSMAGSILLLIWEGIRGSARSTPP